MENQTEFDLNHAIQTWREHLSQSPSYRAENLEELESHLRDSVATLAFGGLSEEEAFLIATRRVGASRALEPEFAKVNSQEVWLGRLLWMLVGIQAWHLISLLSSVVSRTGVHLLIAGFPALSRGFATTGPAVQTASGISLSVTPSVFFFVADIVALMAIATGCWWLIRRTESGLSRLLQRPRWVALGMGGMCLALLLGSALGWLGQAVMARFLVPSDYGKIAYAMSMAGLPLSALKTIALAILTVLLARRRLRLAYA